ncbi:hypothetical protein BDZ85DRAFT_75791 [Elsinoe ampelina]|uniref:Uncharacterized protein n=1 Tax=Elsinoe ampelina TaxID=302913 RepID=A0A6A6GK27_9PEZI|nr:hypothetical protein BDZ85DRAFT_75791 [Elsinoe ampelina]
MSRRPIRCRSRYFRGFSASLAWARPTFRSRQASWPFPGGRSFLASTCAAFRDAFPSSRPLLVLLVILSRSPFVFLFVPVPCQLFSYLHCRQNTETLRINITLPAYILFFPIDKFSRLLSASQILCVPSSLPCALASSASIGSSLCLCFKLRLQKRR